MAAVLYGTAPSYLAESIRRRADVEGRRHLRWSNCPVSEQAFCCRRRADEKQSAVISSSCHFTPRLPTTTEDITSFLRAVQALLTAEPTQLVVY